MPRLINRNPRYRKHRASGQAVVTLNGKDHYLGPHGSKASKDEYDRLIAEWLANGRRLAGARSDCFVAELAAGFMEFAEVEYGGVGKHKGELSAYRLMIRILDRLYGDTPAAEFGPRALKAVREAMIEAGWARKYINRQVGRLIRVFKWGVETELVSVEVHQTLKAVPGLRFGKSKAPESEPVKPVPEERVQAILPHVSRQVKAMIELQQITAMRPGEVCAMRGCDLDTTGKLWTYKPAKHKTQHHGHERIIYLGPRAQEIIGQFLKTDLSAYLFSPANAEAERRLKLTTGKHKSNRKRRPGRVPGERYSVDAYRRAIVYGCEVAFGMPAELRFKPCPKRATPEQRKEHQAKEKEKAAARAKWHALHTWHPNQLRHNRATELRKSYGLEAAQVILGHQTLSVTQVYAEKNVQAAQRIMADVG